ncbi:hypothetical protein ILYODFUR_006043 [Ilyodon furcidens]|uniref:Uncharacterized protein n=1 Tax=Ilyodon furcidens TaxID=33524 RepID=A0ABV0UDQ0_9TELE
MKTPQKRWNFLHRNSSGFLNSGSFKRSRTKFLDQLSNFQDKRQHHLQQHERYHSSPQWTREGPTQPTPCEGTRRVAG